jgi:hypothetical protein
LALTINEAGSGYGIDHVPLQLVARQDVELIACSVTAL